MASLLQARTSNGAGDSPLSQPLTRQSNTRSFGRSTANRLRSAVPGTISSFAAACSSAVRVWVVSSMPTTFGLSPVSMVTTVSHLADSSPIAARCASTYASVMPPAHSPSRLILSLRVIFLAAPLARSAAAR